jgi:hypothetical protein
MCRQEIHLLLKKVDEAKAIGMLHPEECEHEMFVVVC